jgi:hypothetical protein
VTAVTKNFLKIVLPDSTINDVRAMESNKDRYRICIFRGHSKTEADTDNSHNRNISREE